jgi:hypothetical protein
MLKKPFYTVAERAGRCDRLERQSLILSGVRVDTAAVTEFVRVLQNTMIV